jgi:hypothetical protein
MHIEVLVEDSSGASLMGHLIPKLLGGMAEQYTWRIKGYRGLGHIPKNMTMKSDEAKNTLLANLPRILQGYGRTPGYDAVLVLVDTDDRDAILYSS